MRRFVILAFTLAFSFTGLAQQAAPPQQKPAAPPAAAPAPPPLTPEVIWNALLRGNKNFTAGKIRFDTLNEERIALKEHQSPPVTVLSCSDSRVPPELVFDQSLGAIFGVRTAGNVADEFSIASIEFGILSGWTKLIVVLGHENCGAVKAALAGTDPPTPALNKMVEQIRGSFIGIAFDSRDAANFKRAIETNSRASAAQLIAGSAVIRRAVQTEQIKIISAYYDFGTGEVKSVP